MKINHLGSGIFNDRQFRIFRPNGSGDFDMVFMQTPAYIRLGGTRRRVEKDTFILYAPDDAQDYGAVEDPYIDYFIHFYFENDLYYLQNCKITPCRPIRLYNAREIFLLFGQIKKEFFRSADDSHEAYNLLMRLLMLKIAENLNADARQQGPYYDQMLSLRTCIFSNPGQNFTIAELAKSVNMSESYLFAVYKQAFGSTVMRDVILSRVEHAKYLLKTTGLSVKEIAGACGYRTEEHFMRQFKKITGSRPSDYRNACRGPAGQARGVI